MSYQRNNECRKTGCWGILKATGDGRWRCDTCQSYFPKYVRNE